MKKAIIHTPVADFECEAPTQKELFKEIAEIQEIFAERQCGRCQSEELRFVHRVAQSFDFFELQCDACGAKLVYGQSKEDKGRLFPNRKLLPNGKPDWKEGEYDREHNGWTMYRGDDDSGETHHPPAAPPSKPATASSPTPAANGVPKTKDELVKRLDAKERELVTAGLCRKGDLFAAAQKGAGVDWKATWTEHQVQAAYSFAGSYIREKTQPKESAA